MKDHVSRTGSPGVRLGLALAASLVLHVLVLLPWPGARPPPRVAEPPALEATLLAPLLQTRETPPEPVPAHAVPPPVLPAAAEPSAPAPASAPRPRPQPLAGRALDAALAAIVREDFYPRAAIERGLEGRVVLLLDLDERGAVTRVEVASSSGHALLDAAAAKAARRIGSLPGGRRQALLPVEFRLD